MTRFLLDVAQLVIGHCQRIGVGRLFQLGNGLQDRAAGLVQTGCGLEDSTFLDQSDGGFLGLAAFMVDVIGLVNRFHGLVGLVVEQIELTGKAQACGNSVRTVHFSLHLNGFLDIGDAGPRVVHSQVDGGH